MIWPCVKIGLVLRKRAEVIIHWERKTAQVGNRRKEEVPKDLGWDDSNDQR
jgi:hypothetical protein